MYLLGVYWDDAQGVETGCEGLNPAMIVHFRGRWIAKSGKKKTALISFFSGVCKPALVEQHFDGLLSGQGRRLEDLLIGRGGLHQEIGGLHAQMVTDELERVGKDRLLPVEVSVHGRKAQSRVLGDLYLAHAFIEGDGLQFLPNRDS